MKNCQCNSLKTIKNPSSPSEIMKQINKQKTSKKYSKGGSCKKM